MSLNLHIHVDADTLIEIDEAHGTMWVNVGAWPAELAFFVTSPEAADRLAAAFRELAERMRARDEPPDIDGGEADEPGSPWRGDEAAESQREQMVSWQRIE